MNEKLSCDPKRIELFLEQQLSNEEQTAFELHLDDCERLPPAAGGGRGRPRRLVRRYEILFRASDCRRILWSRATPTGRSGDRRRCNRSATTRCLRLLAPTDDDRMIGRLGTYEVVGVVGSGGMGVVLKAFDAALNRYVAIKVLAPHLGSSGAARKRFSREAQAAAAVVHDNVMEIYGVADANGLPYLVMPYVRGPSLQRRLDDEGPLALVEILRIAACRPRPAWPPPTPKGWSTAT